MINIGTINKISQDLTLGQIDVYDIKNPEFVDFGEIQTIPYGKARSYDLNTTVAIYMVIGDSLDQNRERTFVGYPQARPLFPH